MALDFYRQTKPTQLPLSFAGYKKMTFHEEKPGAMSLQDRIKKVIEDMPGPHRGKQVKLAQIADEPKQTVNHWLTGRVNEIRYEAARRISEHFGYRVDWLMLGKGPVRQGEKEEPEQTAEVMHLVYLTPAEMEIITQYRACDELGRQIIRTVSSQQKKV